MVLCNKTARSAGMIAHRHQTQACGVRCEEQRLSATGQVRFIHHDGHPCKGQRGLFAIRVWEPFEVLGEYCGVVKVPNDQEARQCDSDYAVAVYKSATWTPFIDASRAGNETRFINDFRGVAGSPNCKFSQSHVGGRPAILVVITRQVKEEEELLVDYGDVYWAGSTYRE
mmetsp:Transcript_11252/g.38413  ORF Transcript_11252/g.38413 Transcript_11252/m.38413 type:complete len:170 (-) Transcript_11252:1674-2183(-)